MKVKLLKKLRNKGRDAVEVISVTTTNGVVTGMSLLLPSSDYRGLFSFGNTENEVKEKACKVWLDLNLEQIRFRYKKYSRKYHNQTP